MIRISHLFLCLSFVFILSKNCFSQVRESTFYTAADGLPSNSIISISESESSKIAFAGKNGISTFFQGNFEYLNVAKQVAKQTMATCFVKEDLVFFDNFSGSFQIAKNNNQISKLNIPSFPGLPVKEILYNELNKSLYINCLDKILVYSLSVSRLLDTIKFESNKNFIFAITIQDENLICGTNAGLHYYNFNQKKWTKSLLKNQSFYSLIAVNSRIIATSDGKLFSISKDKIQIFKTDFLNPYFPISSIAYNKKTDEIWLSQANSGSFVFNLAKEGKGWFQVSDKVFNKIYCDNLGNTWCSLPNQGGIMKFNHHFISQFALHKTKVNDAVNSIYIQDELELISTSSSLYFKENEEIKELDVRQFGNVILQKIFYNKTNNRFLLYSKYAEPHVLKSAKYSFEWVNSLQNLDQSSQYSNVNFEYEIKNDTLFYYTKNSTVEQIFFVDTSKYKYEFWKEGIYLQTVDSFIVHDLNLNKSNAFALPKDLKSSYKLAVNSLYEVYLGSENGLFIYFKNRCLKLNRENGLVFDQINDLAITANNKNLHVATSLGLLIIDINGLKNHIQSSPIIKDFSFFLNGNELRKSTKVFENYENLSLQIQFEYSELKNAKLIRFRENAKTKWKNTSSDKLFLDNLTAGKYKIEVQTAISAGFWGKSFSIPLQIHQKFYNTLWFKILVFAAICSIVLLLFLMRIKNLKKAEFTKRELNKKMMELEQKALSASMNPHFIFNSLNSIQYFIHQNKQKEASDFLASFAKLIRQNMEGSMQPRATLDLEIERLENYLKLEKLRFGEKFQYEIEVDEGLDTEDIKVPSMIIQPFVENSIWHGIIPKKEGGKVKVTIHLQSENLLIIEILDNGIGINAAQKNKKRDHISRGMAMSEERLKNADLNSTNKLKKYIEIADTGSGTLVKLFVSIQE